MQNRKPHSLSGNRNSSIELLKIFGIILIVLSHVVQSLHAQNEFLAVNDYILNIHMATTNIQHLVLALLRYSGALGNTIFFACSAWFLLDSSKADKRKILQMLLDVWVVSAIILIVVFILRGGNLGFKMIVKQLLPTTLGNNWYITCYLLFYPMHPFLNWIIKKMEQKTLLMTNLVLLFLYVGVNFVSPGRFFSSFIILWVTIYFAIAYMKFYLADFSNNIKINVLLLALGLIGNTAVVLLTNFLGLHINMFSSWLLRWNSNYNPFLILMAVSLLNIARNVYFKNKLINYASGLSLLIYVIHENFLVRSFYRPLMWHYVYNQFGYEHILLWLFVLVAIVFGFGLMASILYKCTIQKVVTMVCNWLYPILQKLYKKAEGYILSLH